VEALSEAKSANSHYNRGNALAHIQQFEDAIAAYDEALRQKPNFEDAKFNRELVEKLLQQQENQQEQSENSEQNVEQEQEEKQQGENDKQDQDQENQEQQQQQAESEAEQEQQKQNQMAGQNESSEKDQSTDQWLRQIPDDPGGLLKQKFLRDYLRRKERG